MKLKLIFLLIIFLGLAGYFVIRNGYYPLAIVNGTPIFASAFIENYGSALIYYQNIFQAYSKNVPLSSSDILEELKRATLDKLIEDVLIYQELNKIVGESKASKLVSEKIPNFHESAVSLYGLTPERFKELVLAPQARREVLELKILDNKQSFNDWLKEVRHSAKVIVFSSKLAWDGIVVVND